MRPGRLDRILYVGPPDRHGREEIIRIRTAKMSVGGGVDFAELAEMVRSMVSHHSTILNAFLGTDGRLLWSGDCSNVSRRGTVRHAGKYTYVAYC